MTTETTEATTEASPHSPTNTTAGADVPYGELLKRYENAVRDNVKYRDERTGLKTQLQTLEDQARKVVELETAKAKAEHDGRERAAKADFRARLRQSGIDNANALKLLDLSAVKYDEHGDVENADDVWAKFQEANAFLFKQEAKSDTSTSSVQKKPSASITEVDWMAASADMLKKKPSQL